jgi:hypothetical protein
VPAATHEAIATAVRDVIAALPGVPTVVVRAQAFRVDGDTLPLVLVTMGDERELRRLTGGLALREYVLVVTVLYAKDQKLETLVGDAKGWREAIRRVLLPDDVVTESLLAEPTVYAVDAVEMPTEDAGAYRGNYQTARLGLVYRNSETVRG